MSQSRRARRMENHHKRKRTVALNLVALMDIFTILVFFLLVNSSNIQPGGAAIKLPQSIAEQPPKETFVVTVGADDILVQGRKIASVSEVLASDQDLIEGLKQELLYQAQRTGGLEEGKPREREITVMADKQIPYRLLRRILLTCSQSDYSLVSLAVIRKAPERES